MNIKIPKKVRKCAVTLFNRIDELIRCHASKSKLGKYSFNSLRNWMEICRYLSCVDIYPSQLERAFVLWIKETNHIDSHIVIPYKTLENWLNRRFQETYHIFPKDEDEELL